MLESQKTIEERKQEIIDQLEVLRAYMGGVPTEIVHSNTRFKVRRGWFQSILFDMDGVLVDSMKFHLMSWKELLKTFNIIKYKINKIS